MTRQRSPVQQSRTIVGIGAGTLGVAVVLLIAVNRQPATANENNASATTDTAEQMSADAESADAEQAEAESADADSADSAAASSLPPRIDTSFEAEPLPPLTAVEAGPPRKVMFLGYMTPIIEAVNDEVRERRQAVLMAEQRLADGELDSAAREWLQVMARRYRVDGETVEQQIAGLKRHVDIIPVSLALAQGALESAWGTSRFARQGNNIFGKWCFEPGCGIVPARRPNNATYEVAAYPDVAEATRDYMHHLNSHPIYEPLRGRRAAARANNESPKGHDLAAGLEFYSAKGDEYIRMIRGTIEANDLDEARAVY